MINVIVTYTVKQEFVEENKQNIQVFLNDFKLLPHLNFTYKVLLQDDGKTFVHISSYENEEIQTEVLNVPSFQNFQKRRDESNLEENPKIETLEFLGEN